MRRLTTKMSAESSLSVIIFIFQNYNTTVVPAQLTPKEPPEGNEIQFFGNEYQAWDRYNVLISKRTVDIKTAAEDGIILFAPLMSDENVGKAKPDKLYLIIEMVNGAIGFRCDCFA